MPDRPSISELELSDAELLELIKNHGIDRRSLMKALGIGTALSLSAGSAAAKHDDPHPPNIDPHYGYSTPDADNIPKKLEPDHEVELHLIFPNPPENQPPMFHFAPSGLSVDAGDIVQFTFTAPDHTITSYHPAHGFQQRVPEGAPPFSSPVISAGGAWLYRFEKEGLYDMYCGPHRILGMAMRIVVGDLSDEDIPDYEDTFEGSEGPPPLLPPFGKASLEHELHNFTAFVEGDNEGCEWVWLTPKEILDTDALDPGNIQEGDGKVSFSEVLDDIDRADVNHVHE
ncbi:plastocyanin/azurin family copper-binding protein [Haloarcula sp. JP-L23]|uniref:cupredoxin domain-containing protein n=1 Tax=Haloarcula sp. JP-L23 TaxID=2716717 RepID=UPI00140EA516|nr:plastocyanin [Haloarcula sp. JP-L23]